MKSLIDIIIPYYNINDDMCKSLVECLSRQTLIGACQIILVDDGIHQEELIRQYFDNTDLNYKIISKDTNEGPGAARNLGIASSSSEYIIFWDFDDYFVYDDLIRILYNKIRNNLDILYFKFINTYDTCMGYIISRKFINTYDLRFPPIYVDEDGLFTEFISICRPRMEIMNLDHDAAIYNYITNGNNILNWESSGYIKCVNRILTALISTYFIINTVIDQDEVASRCNENFEIILNCIMDNNLDEPDKDNLYCISDILINRLLNNNTNTDSIILSFFNNDILINHKILNKCINYVLFDLLRIEKEN